MPESKDSSKESKFSDLFAARSGRADRGVGRGEAGPREAPEEEPQESTHKEPDKSAEKTSSRTSSAARATRVTQEEEEAPEADRQTTPPPPQGQSAGGTETKETKRPPGRPPGKRSNPDYEQATVYIRKDTHKAVKVALLQQADDRQFSELVEDLLREWIES